MFKLLTYNIIGLFFLQQILFITPVYAQEQQKIFSTEKKNIGSADTASFRQIVRHANKLRFTAPDSCLFLFQQALDKSKSINYTDGIAEALIAMSILYHDK